MKTTPAERKRAPQLQSKARQTKGLPSLQSVQTFNELKEVIELRCRQVPTNYMDKLLLENKHRRSRLSALLKDFNAYAPDYQHFSSVASIKDHIRYRERKRGWVFETSDDPDDPVVVLVDLDKSRI